jgi:hypothetical protein
MIKNQTNKRKYFVTKAICFCYKLLQGCYNLLQLVTRLLHSNLLIFIYCNKCNICNSIFKFHRFSIKF